MYKPDEGAHELTVLQHMIDLGGEEHLTWNESIAKIIKEAALLVLNREAERPSEVSLFLTDNAGIRELNHRYRQLDEPTDVLSFGLGDDDGEDVSPTGHVLLGDIIISVERAAAQAGEYGHTLEREMAFLTVHGMLHLLGYDHENESDRAKMRQREEQLLLALGLPREK